MYFIVLILLKGKKYDGYVELIIILVKFPNEKENMRILIIIGDVQNYGSYISR